MGENFLAWHLNAFYVSRLCPIETHGVPVVLKTMKPKHGATRLLFSMLSIMAGVVLIKAIFIGSFFWLMTLELEAENVAGPAPEGDYKIRRMWGEENLGPYLKSAEKWIRRNKEIEQAVGKVYVVAPTGAPNTHGVSFGESWTKLKLQVVGPKGEGTLKLKDCLLYTSDAADE